MCIYSRGIGSLTTYVSRNGAAQNSTSRLKEMHSQGHGRADYKKAIHPIVKKTRTKMKMKTKKKIDENTSNETK